MDLSVALIIAASFAILCTFYIGKRILTIDFSEYSSKNSKKAKLERLLAKKETPLQNSKIRRDMRKAFEKNSDTVGECGSRPSSVKNGYGIPEKNRQSNQQTS